MGHKLSSTFDPGIKISTAKAKLKQQTQTQKRLVSFMGEEREQLAGNSVYVLTWLVFMLE